MMRGLPVLFVLAAGCNSPFGDSPFGLAVTDAEVEAELECAALLYSWCRDADGDGHGTKEGVHPPMAACELLRQAIAAGEGVICLPNEEECTNVDRYVNSCDDCDDNSADVYQSTPECDSSRDEIDNDCDGLIDEDHDVTTSYYADSDGDGYGDPASMIEVSSCEDAPDGYDDDNFDCDDSDSAINPGQVNEGPCGDGIDQNCDDDPGDCALLQKGVAVSTLRHELFEGATAAVALGNVDVDKAGLADFAVGFPTDNTVEIYLSASTSPLSITGAGDFGAALTSGYFNSDDVIDLAVGAPTDGQGHVDVYLGVQGGISTERVTSFGAGGDREFDYGIGSTLVSLPGKLGGFVVAYADSYAKESKWASYSFSATTGATAESDYGDFKTATDWPLALASATFGKDTYVGVGASNGVSGADPGLALYILLDPLPELKLTDEAGATSALGASLAFGTLTNGKSLVIVGAPGTGAVYMLEDTLSGEFNVHLDNSSTRDPYWEAAGAGSSVAFIGDIDLDGDEDLAIGGNNTLWIIEQGKDGFPGGDLDEVASGKITGFNGIIRHIVNAGDVDGDLHPDLLISTDSTTNLLYGGHKPAQEDASDTGN